MKTELKMPDLSTTGSPLKIAKWLIDTGWPIERGQAVLEVETDKATMEVEATVDGWLLERRAEVGAELMAGEVLAVIETEEQATESGFVAQEEGGKERSEAYSREFLLMLYERIVLVRRFEERVKALFLEGTMPGTIHQCQGQEATAVGVCAALEEQDFITSTFRGHGHALAKGLTPREILDELFGAVTGCCQGKGGSMHIGNLSKGMIPGIAIVAGGIPVAAGMGLAFKMRKTRQVVACFFGDGAVSEGAFHEGLNMAAIWNLPVIFVCENNLYGASTRIDRVMKDTRISNRATSYGFRGEKVDGNDVLAVYEAAKQAVAECRKGAGPVMLELLTYRRTGHSRRDPCNYQPRQERDAWSQRDPIALFGESLIQRSDIKKSDLAELHARIDREIELAVKQAQSAPKPSLDDLMADVYAGQPGASSVLSAK
jgi:TPP-dependent pyruvate/acetoin dehydrogenase alpha subunit